MLCGYFSIERQCLGSARDNETAKQYWETQ